MSDTNQQEKDDYVNFNMLNLFMNLFKSLIHEILTKEIGVEISLEDYNNLSDEEKSSGNYFIKDAGPVNEFSQILDTLSQIESNEEAYKCVGALAIKELLANIILKTDIVDNFLSAATNLPASANSVRVLNNKINNLITVKKITVLNTTSIAGNTGYGGTYDVGMDGYTAVGIVGHYINHGYAVLTFSELLDNQQYSYHIHNIINDDITINVFRIDVLYIKS